MAGYMRSLLMKRVLGPNQWWVLVVAVLLVIAMLAVLWQVVPGAQRGEALQLLSLRADVPVTTGE